ncbi:MAG: xanthine dehydrogenase [Rhodobiaceae bacterium]|nr:xanthine dehydrogenase [Rhodobiaceae bacterium]MBJ66005.1 xanthine dehydrogenase [Rhodobiaceae bacterium]|tara:strand:- start:313 stop:639 length:327 start_codon:yes stop_codon:yes gene_type:complete
MSNYEVIQEANEWIQKGHKVALATVLKTWGSAPRRAGSQLAIRDDGHMTGSVSGGCVEGDVVANALDLFKNPKVKIIDYGITNDTAWEVGLACGGDIRIRLEILNNEK